MQSSINNGEIKMFDQIKINKTFIGYDDGMRKFKVIIRYNKKQYTCDYFIGSALSESDVNIKNVMYSILMDASFAVYSFVDFCNELGYSDDSIKAHNIWLKCVRTNKRINAMFTQSELDTMRELLVDY